MTIRALQLVPARRWCREVPDAAAMLAEPESLWVAHPARRFAIDPPDFALADDPLTSPDFHGEGRMDLRSHTVEAGATFVAHLRDATVLTLAGLHTHRNPFTVVVASGLALADAYHDRALSERLMAITDELVPARVHGRTVDLPLYDDQPPDQTIDGPAILFASRFTHHNYFHWMFEGVARLWCLEALPGGDRLPLLTPWRKPRRFHADVLEALGLRNPMRPLAGNRVRVRRLLFPSFNHPGTYAAPSIDWLRRRLLPAFGVQPWPRGGRRLYLSRADASTRGLAREGEVMRLLQAHGFEAVVPGRMTVAEQIRAFAEAAVVVAPHGAGNTNMIFAPPGATLLELVPETTGAPLYWITAKQAGQRYGRLLCPQDPASGALEVAPERLEPLLRQALSAA